MTGVDAPSGSIDTDDRLLEEFRLTRFVAIQWVVVSTVGFFVWTYLFGLAYTALTDHSLEPITVSVTSPLSALTTIGVFALLLLLVVVLHEFLHGVAMDRFGAEPTYGVGVSHFVLPYAYAESDGTGYTRNQLLVVLLAPLVVITTVGLVGLAVTASPLLIVPLAANAAGSIGDLWMAAVLSRYPPGVRVAEPPDDRTGFGIYGSPADRPTPRPSITASIGAFVYGAVATVVALSVGVFAILIGSLAFGSGDVVLGDPGGFWFLFRHEIDRDELGAVFEIGVPLVLALAAVGGVLTAACSMAIRRFARTRTWT